MVRPCFKTSSMLRDFYQTPLGKVTRQLLRTRIRDMWPDVRGQSVLGLGFATPFLQAFRGEAERVLAIMPAGQGVVHWPHDRRTSPLLPTRPNCRCRTIRSTTS